MNDRTEYTIGIDLPATEDDDPTRYSKILNTRITQRFRVDSVNYENLRRLFEDSAVAFPDRPNQGPGCDICGIQGAFVHKGSWLCPRHIKEYEERAKPKEPERKRLRCCAAPDRYIRVKVVKSPKKKRKKQTLPRWR